ncbi:MAG: SxtJ family membrane protein [Cocleimonas sp.]
MSTEINTAEVTTTDLRKFGFIMGSMFALIFGLLVPWITDKTSETWPIWPFIVLAVFWLLAIATPEVLRPVNKFWLKFGGIMGWINTRIILGAMFFLLIFPIGLLLKIFGKDSMNRKLEKDADTYRRISTVRDKKHLEKPF